jgi:hypothetical protein
MPRVRASGDAATPRGPEHGARANLLAPEPDRVGGDSRDGRSGADLDTDTLERILSAAAQRLRKGAEDSGTALDEDDARLGRIDDAKIARDGLA